MGPCRLEQQQGTLPSAGRGRGPTDRVRGLTPAEWEPVLLTAYTDLKTSKHTVIRYKQLTCTIKHILK